MKTPVPSKQLVAKLRKWLSDKKHMGDAFVCSPEQWAARKEHVGNGSAATVSIDGSVLFQSFNYGEPPEEAAELQAFAESLGYYIEMGEAWSLHFYPCGSRGTPRPVGYVAVRRGSTQTRREARTQSSNSWRGRYYCLDVNVFNQPCAGKGSRRLQTWKTREGATKALRLNEDVTPIYPTNEELRAAVRAELYTDGVLRAVVEFLEQRENV